MFVIYYKVDYIHLSINKKTMKTKHTQGEWKISKRPISTTVVCNGEDICLLMSGLSEPNKANAKLIAAAPDLLEALQKAYEHFSPIAHQWKGRDVPEGQFMLASMSSAIKKATE